MFNHILNKKYMNDLKHVYEEIFNPSTEMKGVMQTLHMGDKEDLLMMSTEPHEPHYRISMGFECLEEPFFQYLLMRRLKKKMPRIKEFICSQMMVENHFDPQKELSPDKVYFNYTGGFFWVASSDLVGVKVPSSWNYQEE